MKQKLFQSSISRKTVGKILGTNNDDGKKGTQKREKEKKQKIYINGSST